MCGQNRLEIMRRVERIEAYNAGWMYRRKGTGLNASALVKVSEDGKQRVVVCTQMQEIINISPSEVHYLDTRDNLCDR